MMPSSDSNNSVDVIHPHPESKSAGLARNWWAIALRAVLAAGFAIGIFLGSTHTFATLVLLFTAYVAADGVAAIAAGVLKMRRGELWQTLIFEGMLNLFLAGAVLVWPAIAATAFMSLASIWAIATGALLLAAARQISVPYAPALLSLAGLVSITWGLMVTITGPSSDSASDTVGWWLIGYALPFAVVLLALARLLRRQHNQSAWTE